MFRRLLAVLSVPLTIAVMAAAPSAASAAPRELSAVDFEDGTTGAWVQSGGDPSTLRVVPFEDGSVLQVADRDADYVGLQSPSGLLEAGRSYAVSLRIRLAAGTPDTSARVVVKPGYAWVGDTTVTASDWTTVAGSFTAPADAGSEAQVYIGTADIPGVPAYTYLVDDVVVTTVDEDPSPLPDTAPGGAVDPVPTPETAASGSGQVAALTFDDGPNPGTTGELLDYLAARDIRAVFCVIGQNITAPGGAELLRRIVAEGHVLCNHSTTYEDMGSLTEAQAAERMAANLTIIREALGDPDAPVPFFRAPNGTWGNTPAAAVALGMQPLAVINTISDWVTQDVPTLTTNLRAAIVPGQIVLAHDGGGDRSGTLEAVRTVVDERLAAGWTFTLPVGTSDSAPPVPQPSGLLNSDFDDGDLGGWFARAGSATSTPTVAVVAGGADGTPSAAQVSDRSSEGDGIQHDVTGILLAGQTYRISAALRFAPGTDPGAGLTVSMRTVSGGSVSFTNLLQVESASATGWTTVTGQFTVPTYDSAAELYVEARYNSGNTADFLIDQIDVRVPDAPQVDLALTPLKDTVDFPVGVAVDSRETTGPAAELLLHHFDQISPENFMKPEAWYTADRQFVRSAEATSLLDFAQQNDLRLYGHVLVWHQQTPAWFFQDDSGRDLTASAADQQILRDRLREHIDAVADSLAGDYGLFGSDTNPLVAFDVVNEVISDQATPDGLRTSRWHDVLGEEYIPLAFRYADDAFNARLAAPGVERPVQLFINDYNTEQGAKGAQYRALVDRLLADGVPIDGVGHQFHVSVDTPVSSLRGALDRFAGLGLLQEVTEFDATVNPATEANLIRQGYYYRDVFRMLRDYHAAAPVDERLFSVTVWGLTDPRSWRASQEPLLFDGGFQAKPAYYGAIDDDGGLPALVTSANVFGGDVTLDGDITAAPEWVNLPENALTGGLGGFQARWNADHLTVLVRTTVKPDRLEFTDGDDESVYAPGSPGSVEGVSTEVEGTFFTVVHLPRTGIEVGDTTDFDVRVVSGGEVVSAWNSDGATGRLTFLEELSTVAVPEAPLPVVDGQRDALWADAAVLSTSRTVEGDPSGARAEVRSLWSGNTLSVLFDVTDPDIDTSNSDPWNRDSVEVFLDLGNTKAGSYGPNDSQIRIGADGGVSFGTGDVAPQQARIRQSAVTGTDAGYRVELTLELVGQSGGQSDVPFGGLGTFHGLDFQVNDARAGARFAVHTWAEPTGTGYQNTARWGVGELVAADGGAGAPAAPGPADPGAGAPGSGSGSAGPTGRSLPGALAITGLTSSVAAALVAALLLSGGALRVAAQLRRRQAGAHAVPPRPE